MFLKQEKPEMDDFKKRTLVIKEKYFFKFQSFNRYPGKKFTTIFAYSFVSEHSKSFFLREKNLHF